MKKTKIYSIIFIAAIFAVLTGCHSPLIVDIDEEYFGKETFNETKHICSKADLKEIQPVLDQIENAFSYVDKSESCDCEEKFGALSRYCICHPNAISENHDIKFVTAKTEDDTGYIWIKYDQEGFDENQKTCTGSWDILSRIEIKKTDDVWSATDVDEHP